MKKIITALLTALTLLAAPAQAMDRITWFAGSNPPSPNMNQEERDTRLGFGQALFTIFGSTTGVYNNLTIFPVSGLTVDVGPSSANTLGSLYQYLPEEATAVGGYPQGTGVLALPADATKVFLQGMLSTGTASIGPLNGPGTGGQSTDYLIECQVSTTDKTSQTISLVDSSGNITTGTVNRDRADVIACQSKTGTAATTGSQVAPAADAGWVGIGFVAVANGTATITSGMVTMFAPFAGFGGLSPVQLQASTPGSAQTGHFNVTGTGAVGVLSVPVTGGALKLSAIGSAGEIQNTAGGLITMLSSGGVNNVNFPDAGGITVARGNVSLVNALTIANGGTGQTTLPIGSCLAYNGATIVNGNCSTTGGSGVTGATAPITFSSGTIACATCVVLSPGATQTGAIIVSGNVIGGGLTTAGTVQGANVVATSSVVALDRIYAGPNARADVAGDIGSGITANTGRIFFGATNALDFGVNHGGAYSFDSGVYAPALATTTSSPALQFPNSAGGSSITYIGNNHDTPTTACSGITASAFYVSAVGSSNLMTGDGNGNLGICGGLWAQNGVTTTSVSSSGGIVGAAFANTGGAYMTPLYYGPSGAGLGSTSKHVTGQQNVSYACGALQPCGTAAISTNPAFSAGFCTANTSVSFIGVAVTSAATSSFNVALYNTSGGTSSGTLTVYYNCEGN